MSGKKTNPSEVENSWPLKGTRLHDSNITFSFGLFPSVQLWNTHCYHSKESWMTFRYEDNIAALLTDSPFKIFQGRMMTGAITFQMRYRSPRPSDDPLHIPLRRRILCMEEDIQSTVYRTQEIIEWISNGLCLQFGFCMSMQWRQNINMVHEKIDSTSTLHIIPSVPTCKDKGGIRGIFL